ncbi:hypothetical protein [Arthrobacter alkaliphilus]|uniref:hypothetical protein n=1 Tax=Arthrobacter alkaliphilus TaxID=369936 RepID=UPI001F4393A2|nr:hypothetical protein [Arthrobacter alkaliphilus]
MADLPAQLVKISEKQTPARYESPVFGSGGSFGASVSVTFTSTVGRSDVYKAVGDNAVRNGWVARGVDSTGITDRWLKTYPDGTPATLVLISEDPTVTTPRHIYTLAGGV